MTRRRTALRCICAFCTLLPFGVLPIVRLKFRFVRRVLRSLAVCTAGILAATPSFALSTPEFEFQRLVIACDEAVSAKTLDPVDALVLAEIEDSGDCVFGGFARVDKKILRVDFKHSRMLGEPATFLTTCFVWGEHDDRFSPSQILLWERAKAVVRCSEGGTEVTHNHSPNGVNKLDVPYTVSSRPNRISRFPTCQECL